jgi:hypothetical protein
LHRLGYGYLCLPVAPLCKHSYKEWNMLIRSYGLMLINQPEIQEETEF